MIDYKRYLYCGSYNNANVYYANERDYERDKLYRDRTSYWLIAYNSSNGVLVYCNRVIAQARYEGKQWILTDVRPYTYLRNVTDADRYEVVNKSEPKNEKVVDNTVLNSLKVNTDKAYKEIMDYTNTIANVHRVDCEVTAYDLTELRTITNQLYMDIICAQI